MTRPLRLRPAPRSPDLTLPQILDWADAFQARFGRWPTRKAGRVGLTGNTWSGVDACLKGGHRGLPPGSSLAKVLLEHRGRRHRGLLPPLTPELILGWADAHHARTGDWPTQDAGPVIDAPGETWSGVDCALNEGCRFLPGRSSIARLLELHRGVRNHLNLPPLVPEQLLAWADAHHARTGRWPRKDTDKGPIPEAPGEAWGAIDQALLVGVRGLPGGSSLARLLAARRGVRNPAAVPRLEVWEILVWADNHVERTGRWPTATAGAIPETPGETWTAVDSALWAGTRGLPGKDSLARLLARRRGARNPATAPARPVGPRTVPRAAASPLTVEQILAWADAHHARTGGWPRETSGPVREAPAQRWSAVATALEKGGRGLPGGGSLARLLAERRGVRNHMALPPFTVERLLVWADSHHARTGAWPCRDTGAIPDAPGETWGAVEQALTFGLRGLPGGDTLARLLARHRGKRNRKALPPLSLDQIRGWVVAHVRRTGGWPSRTGGPIPEAPGETWAAVDQALYRGQRGMPGGSSLPKVVGECLATQPNPALAATGPR